MRTSSKYCRLVPVMVMFVPPASGPLLGVTLLIVGGGGLKKKAVLAAFVPPAVAASTLAAPGECAGVVAVICVALFTVKLAAFVPPKVTLVAPVKFVPVMVTFVPPLIRPESGLTFATVGAAR